MLLIIIVFIFSLTTFAQPEIPKLQYRASDFTNTLTQSELNNLNLRLKSYEDSTSNQFVSLMIPTLNNYPLEDYSYEVAEKNGIGTKENSNGVLFLVVKDDRKMRIEVGYGLEPVLTDALSSSIIRNEIAPYFRDNQYYSGIISGIDAIIAAIGGEYKSEYKEKSRGLNALEIIILLLIVFIILSIIPKSRKIGRSGGYIYRGGSWGNGGFSGGGGSFGGGGASGSW